MGDEGLRYCVQMRHYDGKMYLFVYDQELIEEKGSIFYRKKVDRKCCGEELALLLAKSVSVNLFGTRSIRKAIEEGYIHPEGVGEIKGIPTAIFIKT